MAGNEFASALAAAILSSGRSLDSLSSHLARRGHPVSDTTLSNWQRGASLPRRTGSLRALAELEKILGLRPGELSRLLEHAHDPAVTAMPYQAAVDRIRERLGISPTPAYDVLAIHEAHHVGPDRCPVRNETRMVIRSTVDGLGEHHHMFLARDGRTDGDVTSTVRAGAGCRTGVKAFEPPDLMCVELQFPRALGLGECHLFEFVTELSYASPPAPELRRAVRRPVGHLAMRLQFDPGAHPDAVYVSRWDHPSEQPEDIRSLALDQMSSTQYVFDSPAPGVLGLRWVWRDDLFRSRAPDERS